MSDVTLHIDGLRYGGWKGIKILKSLEQAAGSFQLQITERWSGEREPWPIRVEDFCRVAIDGETVIDGFVDATDVDLAAGARRTTITGSDHIATLATCSAELDSWTFRNATVLTITQALAAQFDLEVTADAGLDLPTIDKLVVNPGDMAYEAIERAARTAGVLVVADGAGIRITRAGTARADDELVEGDNLKSIRATYDGSKRYRRYKVLTQKAGSDTSHGASSQIRAEAVDEGVRRLNRVLLLRPRQSATVADAKRRADWEARIRAARAQRVNGAVRGWRQSSGRLWTLNELVAVDSPAARVSGDLLISQIDYTLDEGGGEVTRLGLVRPDAYTPEPQLARVKGAPGGTTPGGWPELATGAL